MSLGYVGLVLLGALGYLLAIGVVGITLGLILRVALWVLSI